MKNNKYNIELGLLTKSDGSCRFENGANRVLASVNGPCDVKQRDELVDRAFVDVKYRPCAGLADPFCVKQGSLIKAAVDHCLLAAQHPRTSFQVVVQTLSDDGCTLAAAQNAVSLALMDAGAPLRCFFAAVTVCIMPTAAVSADEENRRPGIQVVDSLASLPAGGADAVMTCCFESSVPTAEGSLIACHLDYGTMSENQLFACIEVAHQHCVKTLFPLQRQTFAKLYK